jgi:O-acetylhomoserine/O-acetylserine sulfhydrylase-like pyridoxal-dependent enzyme
MDRIEWRRNLHVLGLEEEVTFSDIQSAYRKLVMKYHPDVNKDINAPKHFRVIVEAYGTLLEMRKHQHQSSYEELMRRMNKDPMIKHLSYHELENRLNYSSSTNTRVSALIALGMKDDEGAKKIIVKALFDRDASVRDAAFLIACEVCSVRDIGHFFTHLMRFWKPTGLRYCILTVLKIFLRRMRKSSIFSRTFLSENKCTV